MGVEALGMEKEENTRETEGVKRDTKVVLRVSLSGTPSGAPYSYMTGRKIC